VKDEVLTQGWHLISPTVKTTLYTVSIEQSYLTSGNNGDSQADESFSASSSEGKAVTLDLTFTYQFQQDNVTSVFTEFKGQSGKEVRDSFIKPNIISWTKEVVARYKVSDILGSERANVNLALTEYLADKFEPYGITVSNVSLINIEVDSETQQAINAKITAQQNAETQAINNQTAIDKAEAEAKVKLTEAQANADAVRIQTAAEAERYNDLSNAITPQLIQKWEMDARIKHGWVTIQGSGSTIVDSTEN
jgi:regulator of protease activity HflC (stomatin/prohibitin superfamily)